MDTSDPIEIAKYISDLVQEEIRSIESWAKRIPSIQKQALLIEVCRVLDFRHVGKFYNLAPDSQDVNPDFDIRTRGWNKTLSLLLVKDEPLAGVPMVTSDKTTFSHAESLLYHLGRCSLLEESVKLLRFGLMSGTISGQKVSLRRTEEAKLDYYLDYLEEFKYQKLINCADSKDHFSQGHFDTPNIEAELETLVFPFKAFKNTMVGYNATPVTDEYYGALALKNIKDLQEQAGIHSDIKINGITGAELITCICFLNSFNLKHVDMVHVALKHIKDVNYAMSLTRWSTREDIIREISELAGFSIKKSERLLDLLTVTVEHASYYSNKSTPYMPMFLKMKGEFLLTPVSSLFTNPLHGIRDIQNMWSKKNEAAIRAPREGWMVNELLHLFMGNRYKRVKKQVNLKENKKIATDIDAAILDTISGELALFQLKWQDFNSHDIVKRASRAKNFVNQVTKWESSVSRWISKFGEDALLQSLQIKKPPHLKNISVKLFAIGRTASRFKSFGYEQNNKNITICSWQQLVRIRTELGPVENTFQELSVAVEKEKNLNLDLTAVPHQIHLADHTFNLQDSWCIIDDEL